MTMQRSASAFFVLMLMIGLLALLALASSASAVEQLVEFASHAIDRHGYSAVEVRSCLSKSGPLQIWVNPSTGRRANLCQLDAHSFGLQILEPVGERWEEVTAFLKDKLSRLEQVEQYLRNAGYFPVK